MLMLMIPTANQIALRPALAQLFLRILFILFPVLYTSGYHTQVRGGQSNMATCTGTLTEHYEFRPPVGELERVGVVSLDPGWAR